MGNESFWEGIIGGDGDELTPCCPAARPGTSGNVKTLGNTYQFTVDVSDFAPEDIIVTTSNNQIEVHAEKVSMPSSTPHHHPNAAPGMRAPPRPPPSYHNIPIALAITN